MRFRNTVPGTYRYLRKKMIALWQLKIENCKFIDAIIIGDRLWDPVLLTSGSRSGIRNDYFSGSNTFLEIFLLYLQNHVSNVL
jgi:hypothetical protein